MNQEEINKMNDELGNMGKYPYQMYQYFKEHNLNGLEEVVYTADFFMDINTGNVVRDISPIPVFVERCNMDYIKVLKVGKHSQKLKANISVKSGYSNKQQSELRIFETYNEAKDYYLKKKKVKIAFFSNLLDTSLENLKNLQSDLKDDIKNL